MPGPFGLADPDRVRRYPPRRRWSRRGRARRRPRALATTAWRPRRPRRQGTPARSACSGRSSRGWTTPAPPRPWTRCPTMTAARDRGGVELDSKVWVISAPVRMAADAAPDLRLTYAQYETIGLALLRRVPRRGVRAPRRSARRRHVGRHRRGQRRVPVRERRPFGAHLRRRPARLPALHARRRGAGPRDHRGVALPHSHRRLPVAHRRAQSVDPAWWYVIVSLKTASPCCAPTRSATAPSPRCRSKSVSSWAR